MHLISIVFGLMIVLCGTTGCEPGHETIVLLSSGGSLDVQTTDGIRRLDRPNEGVLIEKSQGVATAKTFTPENLLTTFGPAAAAPPRRTEHYTFYFAHGTQLTSASASALTTLQAVLRQPGLRSVLLVGHTDAVGTSTANARLATHRAEMLQQWLLCQSLSEIQVEARGTRYPVMGARGTRIEPRDRRVEVEIMFEPEPHR